MPLPSVPVMLCCSHFQPCHVFCAFLLLRARGRAVFGDIPSLDPTSGLPPAPLPRSTSQTCGLQWLVLFLFILFQVLGQK